MPMPLLTFRLHNQPIDAMTLATCACCVKHEKKLSNAQGKRTCPQRKAWCGRWPVRAPYLQRKYPAQRMNGVSTYSGRKSSAVDGEEKDEGMVGGFRTTTVSAGTSSILPPGDVRPGHMTLAPDITNLIAPRSTCILGRMSGSGQVERQISSLGRSAKAATARWYICAEDGGWDSRGHLGC